MSHSHIFDIKNPEEVEKWLNTAKTNHGEILAVFMLQENYQKYQN